MYSVVKTVVYPSLFTRSSLSINHLHIIQEVFIVFLHKQCRHLMIMSTIVQSKLNPNQQGHFCMLSIRAVRANWPADQGNILQAIVCSSWILRKYKAISTANVILDSLNAHLNRDKLKTTLVPKAYPLSLYRPAGWISRQFQPWCKGCEPRNFKV